MPDEARADQEGAVGAIRLLGEMGGVQDREVLALPALLELGRHLGVELLAQEGQVVLVELLVVAGQGRELLLGARSLFDPAAEGVDPSLEIGPPRFQALHLLLGLLALALVGVGGRGEWRRRAAAASARE